MLNFLQPHVYSLCHFLLQFYNENPFRVFLTGMGISYSIHQNKRYMIPVVIVFPLLFVGMQLYDEGIVLKRKYKNRNQKVLLPPSESANEPTSESEKTPATASVTTQTNITEFKPTEPAQNTSLNPAKTVRKKQNQSWFCGVVIE